MSSKKKKLRPQDSGISKSKRAKTNQATTNNYFSRPLAPVSWLTLAGVVALCALLLTAASELNNDVVASASCFIVLLSGAALLDYFGRKRAIEYPNSAYKSNSLPTAATPLKPLLVFLTLAVLIAQAAATAEPGEWGSPLPYFLAAGFLFLVMPQMLAHLALRKIALQKPSAISDR